MSIEVKNFAPDQDAVSITISDTYLRESRNPTTVFMLVERDDHGRVRVLVQQDGKTVAEYVLGEE